MYILFIFFISILIVLIICLNNSIYESFQCNEVQYDQLIKDKECDIKNCIDNDTLYDMNANCRDKFCSVEKDGSYSCYKTDISDGSFNEKQLDTIFMNCGKKCFYELPNKKTESTLKSKSTPTPNKKTESTSTPRPNKKTESTPTSVYIIQNRELFKYNPLIGYELT